ncbi:unnamed protein product [Lasius platythorax]
MKDKRYIKMSKQMQTRFRTLRLQYNKIRRQMGKSGSGNCMSSFPYAEEMSQLLDFRPIAIGDVVDSIPSQDFPESNNNSYSSNSIYEDEPDPRDGAIPGCSSTSDNSTTDCLLQEDLSSESNTVNLSTVNSAIPVKKKRKLSRSNEAITLRYADKLKENYEEIQSKIMTENRCFIERLMESEKKLEKEIVDNMLESQRSILKETTNQLLNSLQNIFAPKSSTVYPAQLSTISVPTVNPISQSPFVMSPVNYSSSFSSSNLDSQAFRSSSLFPKVLLNVKSPAPERATAASVQQTNTVKKYPQAENEKSIPVQSPLNVTLQDSPNLKCSKTQDFLQFQDIKDSDQI